MASETARRWIFGVAYLATAALLVFLHILPVQVGPRGYPGPDLLLCITFLWVLRRPHYLPTPLEVLENPWIQWCVLLPRDISGPEYDGIREIGTRAVQALGLETVPAIRITHLSAPEKRALMLADNKIALNAGWDLDLLAQELADLSSMELDFSVEITGFEVPEIDLIIEGQSGEAPEPEMAPNLIV